MRIETKIKRSILAATTFETPDNDGLAAGCSGGRVACVGSGALDESKVGGRGYDQDSFVWQGEP